MILCAGLGTRLGALSDQRPKPMLPVCDRPILHYGIANLVAHGIRDLVINLHHRGDVIERELGDGRRFGARIVYVHEPVILGTGGGLKNARALLDPEGRDAAFLSLNGKLIFDLDLDAVLAAHAQALAADPDLLGLMVVRRTPDARSWGAIQVGADDRGSHVTDMLGDGEHMFCGVHVTRPSVVARLPDGEACMIRQGYQPWLRAGGRIAAFEANDVYFAEHSIAERYLASNAALLRGATLRHPPGRLVGIDPTARIHPDAIIIHPVRIGAGAVVSKGAVVGPDVVIGSGAVVADDARIERAVVWPGGRAAGEVRDAIVTDQA